MPDLCLTLSEEEKYPELEGQTPDGGARQRGTPTFTLDLGGWKQARTPASTWSLVFLGTCQGWEADLNTFQVGRRSPTQKGWEPCSPRVSWTLSWGQLCSPPGGERSAARVEFPRASHS